MTVLPTVDPYWPHGKAGPYAQPHPQTTLAEFCAPHVRPAVAELAEVHEISEARPIADAA
jgi:hypothetical protein